VELSLYRVMAKFYRSTCFPLLSPCRLVEFDTSAICHVFMHCFGSFVFQAMFLSSFLVSKYLLSRDKLLN